MNKTMKEIYTSIVGAIFGYVCILIGALGNEYVLMSKTASFIYLITGLIIFGACNLRTIIIFVDIWFKHHNEKKGDKE